MNSAFEIQFPCESACVVPTTRRFFLIQRVLCKTGGGAFAICREGHGISIFSGSRTSWGNGRCTAGNTTRSGPPCSICSSWRASHSSSCSRPQASQQEGRSPPRRRLCCGRATEAEFGLETLLRPLHALQKHQARSCATSRAHSCAGMGEHRQVLSRSVSRCHVFNQIDPRIWDGCARDTQGCSVHSRPLDPLPHHRVLRRQALLAQGADHFGVAQQHPFECSRPRRVLFHVQVPEVAEEA